MFRVEKQDIRNADIILYTTTGFSGLDKIRKSLVYTMSQCICKLVKCVSMKHIWNVVWCRDPQSWNDTFHIMYAHYCFYCVVFRHCFVPVSSSPIGFVSEIHALPRNLCVRAPMRYFTDARSVFAGSSASSSGRAHFFWKTHPKRKSDHSVGFPVPGTCFLWWTICEAPEHRSIA